MGGGDEALISDPMGDGGQYQAIDSNTGDSVRLRLAYQSLPANKTGLFCLIM